MRPVVVDGMTLCSMPLPRDLVVPILRCLLPAMVFVLSSSFADAQLRFERVAEFDSPTDTSRRIRGGRQIEFSADGKTLIAAFYGSRAQLFDLHDHKPIGDSLRTAGDGEVGFVNDAIAYTADWDSMRLWDTKTGKQLGESIPHELREDTIISPAISSQGTLIATRATMKSVQLRDVASRQLIGEAMSYANNVNALRFSPDGTHLLVLAGGSLHVIETKNGKQVAGPFKSGWRFSLFAKPDRLVTTEKTKNGSYQLVIRSTDQPGWPESGRVDLPGQTKQVFELADKKILVQVSKPDYQPALFKIDLNQPNSKSAVAADADRAFTIVVPKDTQHWISSNIHDIRCQRLGDAKPIWLKQIPPSGYDQQLFPLSSQYFIIRDKQENFGVYSVADGSEVWSRPGVRRFSRSDNRIAFGTSTGIEIWTWQDAKAE